VFKMARNFLILLTTAAILCQAVACDSGKNAGGTEGKGDGLIDGWRYVSEVRGRKRTPDDVLLSTYLKRLTLGIPKLSRVAVLDVKFSEPLPQLSFQAARMKAVTAIYMEKQGEIAQVDAIRKVYTMTPGEFETGKAPTMPERGFIDTHRKETSAGRSCDVWSRSTSDDDGTLVEEECWTKDREVPSVSWGPDILPDDGYTMPIKQRKTRKDKKDKLIETSENIVILIERDRFDPRIFKVPPEFGYVSEEEFSK